MVRKSPMFTRVVSLSPFQDPEVRCRSCGGRGRVLAVVYPGRIRRDGQQALGIPSLEAPGAPPARAGVDGGLGQGRACRVA